MLHGIKTGKNKKLDNETRQSKNASTYQITVSIRHTRKRGSSVSNMVREGDTEVVSIVIST